MGSFSSLPSFLLFKYSQLLFALENIEENIINTFCVKRFFSSSSSSLHVLNLLLLSEMVNRKDVFLFLGVEQKKCRESFLPQKKAEQPPRESEGFLSIRVE